MMSSSSSNLNKVLTIFLLICSLTTSYVALAINTPQGWLAPHNKARAEVGVPPLVWSQSLVDYAQKNADSRYEKCEFVHSMGPYGENLAMNYGDMDGTDAVNFWLTEKPNYDHASKKCVNGECGHYTQIVWHDSVRLGCARARCKNGWMFVICSYDPPGNIEGQRPYPPTTSNHY